MQVGPRATCGIQRNPPGAGTPVLEAPPLLEVLTKPCVEAGITLWGRLHYLQQCKHSQGTPKFCLPSGHRRTERNHHAQTFSWEEKQLWMKTNGSAFRGKKEVPTIQSSRCLIIYTKQEHSLSFTGLKLISYFIVPQVFTEEVIIFKNVFHNWLYFKQANCKN